MSWIRAAFILLALSASLPCPAQRSHTIHHKAKAIIGSAEPIPAGYQTYSLFLICNPQWLGPDKSVELSDLYGQFRDFGRSIGDNEVAIWFWKKIIHRGWEYEYNPADVIDVERSVRFCKAWKLKPSDGPFLVITSTRPDEQHLSIGLPKGSAVFNLGGMNPAEISKLLAKLTDSLLLTGKVGTNADMPANPQFDDGSQTLSQTAPPQADALWVRVLTAVQTTINDFGCSWSFKINAGAASADLKPCKSSS